MPTAATEAPSINKKRRRRTRLTVKKRKNTKPDQKLWAFRSILDERTNNAGGVDYLIDWEDDPETGEKYDPSWEADFNVSLGERAKWNEQQRLRALLAEELDTELQATPLNSRSDPAKRKRPSTVTDSDDGNPSKRRRADICSDGPNTQDSQGTTWKLVEEIPEHQTCLIVEVSAPGGFDPSEYIAIHCDGQRSQESQLWVSRVGEDALDQTRATRRTTGLSPTTIPDSQEPTESFSFEATVGDPVTDKLSETLSPLETRGTGVHSPRAFISTRAQRSPPVSVTGAAKESPDLSSSPLDLTSRQLPNPGLVDSASQENPTPQDLCGLSFGERQVVTESGSFHNSAWTSEVVNEDGTTQDPESSSLSQRFNSQPDLETLAETDSQATTSRLAESLPNILPGASNHIETPLDNNSSVVSETSYSAQVVHPVDIPQGLWTHSHSNTQTHGNDSQVIPATSPAGPVIAGTPIHRERPSSAPVERIAKSSPTINRERPTSHPLRGSSPLGFSMDGTTGANALEAELRALQRSTYPFDIPPEAADEATAELDRLLGIPSRPSNDISTTGLEHIGNDHAHADSQLVAATGAEDAHRFDHPLRLTAHHSPPAFKPTALEAPHDVNQPATIAPCQLTMTISPSILNVIPAGAPPLVPPLFESEGHGEETVLRGIESTRSSVEAAELADTLSEGAEPVSEATDEFLVTLPMFATTRNLYLEALRSNRSAMLRYNKYFQSESAGLPEQELVEEVDTVFAKLSAHCDLPLYGDSMQPLEGQAMMKHSTGTNSKYLFIYEFLNNIKDSNLRILILSQPGRVFNYLESIVSGSGCKYTTYLNSQIATPEDEAEDRLHVILETTDQDLSRLPRIDVVILFDSAARSAAIPPTIPVLSLVVTHSIEHINLRLTEDMDELERRNAMSLVLVESQRLLQSLRNEKQPHELAEMFADFFIEPATGLSYEPEDIPDEFFDVFLNSQETQSRAVRLAATEARAHGRKRLFDGGDAEGTPSKRARTVKPSPSSVFERTSQLMSDLLKGTLGRYTPRAEGCPQIVEVPIDQLEWLAATIHQLQETAREKDAVGVRLREHVSQLEHRVKSQSSMLAVNQQRYVTSVQEGNQLVEKLRVAEQNAEKMEKELAGYKAETSVLKEKIRTISTPKEPERKEPETDLDASLRDSKVKLEAAEKKLKGTNNELDYIRGIYQTASNSATELARENKELKDRITDLERLAGDQIVKLHTANATETIQDLQRQLRDARVMIKHREDEIDHVQKELRTVKNGRRETRQTSVPRSPRVPIMSPRPRGGAGSRGTSPAAAVDSSSASATPGPGMSHFSHQTPVANPRLTHLRD